MHLVFYGPEGSGKGTQAKLVSEKLGLPIYTTGDFVREKAASDKGDLGNLCRKALSEGKYLADEIVSRIIFEKLNTPEAKKGFVLDGFPRTLKQAEFLSEIMHKAGYSLDKFIYLKLSQDESVARLSKRKRAIFTGSKILHDSPERVKQRLEVYRTNEKQVLEFYRKDNLLLEIDAQGSIEKVFGEILSGLSPIL